MAPISCSIEVNRPPCEVFDYVTDPTRFPEWQQNVTGGHVDGDRCINTRKVGPIERPFTSAITHVDPPRSWGVRGVDGPIRATVDVTVHGLDDDRRSRVTIAIEFDGHGIGKVLVPLVVRREAEKEMPTNLQQLKNRLEERGTQAGTAAAG